jgi:hypothetical protein
MRCDAIRRYRAQVHAAHHGADGLPVGKRANVVEGVDDARFEQQTALAGLYPEGQPMLAARVAGDDGVVGQHRNGYLSVHSSNCSVFNNTSVQAFRASIPFA